MLYLFDWSSDNLSIERFRSKAESIFERTNWRELFFDFSFFFLRFLLRSTNLIPSVFQFVQFFSSIPQTVCANNFCFDAVACAIDTIYQMCIQVISKKYHEWQMVSIHGAQYFDELWMWNVLNPIFDGILFVSLCCTFQSFVITIGHSEKNTIRRANITVHGSTGKCSMQTKRR